MLAACGQRVGKFKVDLLGYPYVLLYIVHRGRQCGRISHLSISVSLSSR